MSGWGTTREAVAVATPDHMHYAAGIMAITMGKHVFIQKPLTRSVWEARELRLAARKHNVVTQMGNQGHAGDGVRLVREWVQAGLIGNVSAYEDLALEASLRGGRDRVFKALLSHPLIGQYEYAEALTDRLIAHNREHLAWA